MKIERKTGGGWLELADDAPLPECASHGADQADEPDRLIGVTVITQQGRRLETAMCSDCIAAALALYWGREHVRRGGDVADLQYGDGNG